MRFLKCGVVLTWGCCAVGAAFGERDADDQIRYYSGYEPYFHERIRDMGFNLVDLAEKPFAYDYKRDCVTPYDRAKVVELFTRLAADGMEANCDFRPNQKEPCMLEFVRIGRDGKPIMRVNGDKRARGVPLKPSDYEPHIDATHPGFRALLVRAATAIASEYAALGVPGFSGVRALEEVRLFSNPSFSPRNRADYRAATGQEIPAQVMTKKCPMWTQVQDMPADRLIDGDFPLYAYYFWFWKTGDGWREANDIFREAFVKAYGKPVISLYEPGRRVPAIWGIGGNNSHLGDWFYLYPFPFGIQNKISELQASARGTGAKVITAVDGIFKSFETLPKEKAPAKKPSWFAKYGKRAYITIPPDWMTEGFWLMLAKRSDGIGIDVARGVMGCAPGKSYWAPMTNGETLPAMEKVMKEVALPLGPLLKNMPEHEPEVAVLESTAGYFFSGCCTFGWTGRANRFGEYLTAANLPQYTLFSEEIARSGIPKSVRVIFMPECDVLTKADAAKLEEFRRRGGRLVGESTCAPGLKIDATMPGREHPLYKGWPALLQGAETDRMVRELAKKLRELAAYEPYVDSDNPWILVSARSHGSADLVFAVNDRRTAGDYVGGWGTLLDKGVPNKGTVIVRRTAGAVYDLVRHAPVDFTCRDGKTLIPVSYETTDGRALLLTARPLAPLGVAVRNGAIVVTSADKDVMIPIGVLDARGKGLRYGILRNGAWSRPQPTGATAVLNLATGEKIPLAVK